jgi:predicted phage baseplate assembly protein
MYRLEKEGAWINALDPPSAVASLQSDPVQARPAITFLVSEPDSLPWTVRRDLLKSRPEAREFVVEVEAGGQASLRFGDDRFGRRPEVGNHFYTTYRTGNGQQGNVGADSIRHIASDDEDLLAVTNPLPASGGVEAETIEEVRQKAPVAFRTQERAVTPEDYARMAERHPLVQRAVANFRWTGSWRTVFITVDRLGGAPVDAAFEAELRGFLERFRIAGHDVEIEGPHFVPLEIEVRVCVAPGYFTSPIRKELLDIFSSRVLPGGQRGLFHPDQFTFGQPVYLSRLYAAAQAVEGVATVEITTFQRQGTTSALALQSGEIALDPLEIARLDSDPNFPDRGIIKINVEGGQ